MDKKHFSLRCGNGFVQLELPDKFNKYYNLWFFVGNDTFRLKLTRKKLDTFIQCVYNKKPNQYFKDILSFSSSSNKVWVVDKENSDIYVGFDYIELINYINFILE